MCGILAAIGKNNPEQISLLSKRMTHRGPDENGLVQTDNGSVLSHERLSIIDLNTGIQPIPADNNQTWMVHNGEIYNHQQIRRELPDYPFKTKSDSEVIIALYRKYGFEFCNKLDGIFAFVIVDHDTFMAARDPIGVKPLYYGRDKEGKMYFASEMKAISDQCIEMEAFPPGYYYTPQTGFVKYAKPDWENPFVAKQKADLKQLREALIKATKKRLMTDVPLGVLLSGGLDSSLIASITKRLLPDAELHSFSVGIDADAPDLKAAQKVADFIGTKHHNVLFSVEEGIKAIKKIIWHLETYDVTTIRAATPMYFLSKYIKEAGIKVVLSGEGADEIFGGYLYFHNAPNAIEFQKELIQRVQNLSTADCLRADKSTMAHGLEARVPFLDKEFLNVAMQISPEDKQPDKNAGKPEKYILRAAFDDKEHPYLPEDVLWRQKEQFSDGIGYSWIDELKAYCEAQVSDEEFAKAKELFPYNTPDTKEAFYFRTLFEEMYPEQHAIKTVKKWIPKWQESKDPSGRASTIHDQSILKSAKKKKSA